MRCFRHSDRQIDKHYLSTIKTKAQEARNIQIFSKYGPVLAWLIRDLLHERQCPVQFLRSDIGPAMEQSDGLI